MNLKLIILLIISTSYSVAFIPYPFLTNNLLKSFLDVVKTDDIIELEHMTLGSECYRKCDPNDRRICYFAFALKAFQIMGG
jgi:hypothetical protein